MVHHSALHPQPHPISHPRQLLLPPGSPEALAIRRTRIHNDDLTKSYPSSHNEDTLRLSKAHNPDSDAITLKPAPNIPAGEETGKAPSSSAEHQSTNATSLPRLDTSPDSSRSLRRQVQGSLENPSGWDITHTQWAPNSDRLRRLPPIGANSPTFPRSDPQMPLNPWFITLLLIKAIHQFPTRSRTEKQERRPGPSQGNSASTESSFTLNISPPHCWRMGRIGTATK